MSAQDVQAVLQVVMIVRDAIKEAGDQGLASGHLYAVLMGKMSLETYTSIIETLKASGMVRESGHVLYYCEATR